jgi:hypothetical protein
VTPFWDRESQPSAEDVELELAREEAKGALPEGWELGETDREHYMTGEHGFNSWAAFASGQAERLPWPSRSLRRSRCANSRGGCAASSK